MSQLIQDSNSGRNIIIRLDGTGNKFKENNTNVVKLFRVLIRDNDRQLVYYDPGVGTLAEPGLRLPIIRKISKVIGLIFWKGLFTNVK